MAYLSARSRRVPPIGFIQPCRPTLVAAPPAGPGWLHEMKHDGYRLLARKDADRVRLWTRYGTDFTDQMRAIADAVRSLPADNALIDGEAVVFRPDGIPTLPPAHEGGRRASLIRRVRLSALRATISASGLWKSGERRSRGWSRESTASGSARPHDRGRDRVRPRLQARPGRDRVEARRQPLSQRAEPQLAQMPEPGVSAAMMQEGNSDSF